MYLRFDVAQDVQFLSEMAKHFQSCQSSGISEMKIINLGGWYHRLEYTCKCGMVIHRWNSLVNSSCGKADINIRVPLAARLAKLGATRLHEFELMSGVRSAMDRKYITKFFDEVHEVADKLLQAVMAKNRQIAAEDARNSDNYIF
jgi:hypothetical protein